MIKCLIFDLSEVLIRGIVGIEQVLTGKLNIPQKKILNAFGGNNLVQFCLGKISENEYLDNIIELEKWIISRDELKKALRKNFLIAIKGMPELIIELSGRYKLLLLSDHGREWVEFIETEHGFLNCFDQRYYSFLDGSLKSEAGKFARLLQENELQADQVLFIDDNPENVEAARKAGINGIVFINKAQLIKLLNTEK